MSVTLILFSYILAIYKRWLKIWGFIIDLLYTITKLTLPLQENKKSIQLLQTNNSLLNFGGKSDTFFDNGQSMFLLLQNFKVQLGILSKIIVVNSKPNLNTYFDYSGISLATQFYIQFYFCYGRDKTLHQVLHVPTIINDIVERQINKVGYKINCKANRSSFSVPCSQFHRMVGCELKKRRSNFLF